MSESNQKRIQSLLRYYKEENERLIEANQKLQNQVDEMTSSMNQNADSQPYQNDYELAITASKELEQMFKTHFEMKETLSKCIGEAQSSGLIPKSLARNLYYVANTRNQLCHKPSYQAIKNRKKFTTKYFNARVQLLQLAECRQLSAAKILE